MFISQTSIDDHELGLARSVIKGNTDFPVASYKSFKRRLFQREHMCIFEDEEAKRYGYLENTCKMMKTQDKIYHEPIQSKARKNYETKRSLSIDLGGICAHKNYQGKLSILLSNRIDFKIFLAGSLDRTILLLKFRIFESKIERPTVFPSSGKRRSSVFF